MDINKLDMYLMINSKYFPQDKMHFLRERLMELDDNRFMMLSAVEMKDPTTLLIISIFLGTYGIDRFMVGDTGMGILKLLTGGLCGILTIIDWFGIQDMTREYNFKNIMAII